MPNKLQEHKRIHDILGVGAGGGGSSSHGSLTGLGDDDHLQYHNDARALTWLGTRSTNDLPESVNLYFTDARVSANAAVAANTAARHAAVTVSDTSTINLSLTGQEISAAVIPGGLNLQDLGGAVTDSQVPNTISLTDITQITNRSHTNLSDIGTNTHAQIDSHLSVASGIYHFAVGDIDHAALNNLNSANYTHLSSTNHTDLTDGGDTTLHTHDARYYTESEILVLVSGVNHGDLENIGANDHHAESHTIASHSDTTATGTQLNTLVGGSSSNADTLHTHSNFLTSLSSTVDGGGSALTLQSYGSYATINAYAANGTLAAPTNVLDSAYLLFIGARGYKATQWSGAQAAMMMCPAQNWTDSAAGSYIRWATTPNNSTSRSDRMRLNHTGELWLTEISAPGTPLSGWGAMYPKSDGKFYFKNDSGTEYDLTANTTDHTALSNLNSASYTHLTATNHTDLTDGGNTTLHHHDSRYYTETELDLIHTAIGGSITASGVTNGNNHDHSGGDGAQIDHGGLGGLTDDDHTGYVLATPTNSANEIAYYTANRTVSSDTDFQWNPSTDVLSILGNTAASGKLKLAGGNISTGYTRSTISLGYSSNGQYPNFISTRHNSGTPVNNTIDFFTSDGTAAGVFPTNAVHGLTIDNAKVGIATAVPTDRLTVSGNIALIDATDNRIYHTSDVLNIGTDAATSHSLGAGSVLFGGPVEMDDYLRMDGVAVFYGGTIHTGAQYYGDYAANYSNIVANTTYDQWVFATGSQHANTFIITEYANRAKDHGRAGLQTDPTLFVYSSGDVDSDDTQWLSLSHTTTSGIISTGYGDLELSPASDVVVPNKARLGSAVVGTDIGVELFESAVNSGDNPRLRLHGVGYSTPRYADISIDQYGRLNFSASSGVTYFDGVLNVGSTINFPSTQRHKFGTGYNQYAAMLQLGYYGVTPDGRNFIICATSPGNFGHPANTDPHVYIHSETITASSTEYMEFFHDQSNAHIETGSGNLYLFPAEDIVVSGHRIYDNSTTLNLGGSYTTVSGVTGSVGIGKDAADISLEVEGKSYFGNDIYLGTGKNIYFDSNGHSYIATGEDYFRIYTNGSESFTCFASTLRCMKPVDFSNNRLYGSNATLRLGKAGTPSVATTVSEDVYCGADLEVEDKLWVKGDLDVSGDITVSGTVDGVNIAEHAADTSIHSLVIIEDTPTNGHTTSGISSNWAFDHSVPDAHHPESHTIASHSDKITVTDIEDYIAGSLISWNAAGHGNYVPPGDSGEVLTGNGAAEPSFQALPSFLLISDIDDTPINGETSAPISSNWAFDHAADTSIHFQTNIEDTPTNGHTTSGISSNWAYDHQFADAHHSEVHTISSHSDQVTIFDLEDATAGQLITWDAGGSPDYVLVGNSGEVLTSNGAGAAPTFQASTGDVVGPASATDNAICRFNLTTGKLIQDSLATIDDSGGLTAVTKSFLIDHPTKPGQKLQYGSLEGPEHGVYVRGRSTSHTIELPDYWMGLIDEKTITVQLTPIGNYQYLYFDKVIDNEVIIGSGKLDVEYFYFIQAERKDISKLIVEP